MAKNRIEMSKPLPEDPKKKEKKTVSEIKFDEKSDDFNEDERKELLKIIENDVEYGKKIQEDYISQKELDLKHYHNVKPSELEGLTKYDWQSDRNLGLARAIADSYQATLLATCWNPESINFVASTAGDIDNRNNQAIFTKWGMGKHECNMQPEADGFVQNRIVVGMSFFKVYKKRYPLWVDTRVPVKNSKGVTYKYDITTEKKMIEKGLIENIPDIDDILMPAYGKNIQELPWFIYCLHLDGEKVLECLEKGRRVFKPVDLKVYKKNLRQHAYQDKARVLGSEKLKALGVTESGMTDDDVRRLTIDLYEWYGYYTKNGRTERYRCIVDLKNQEFLSGKPVRKLNRLSKIPFAGGSLCKEPGMIRGISLMQIIAPVVNAFNNVFNQKSDFQYVTNCPFGFHNPEEGYQKQVYELTPGVSYPVAGEPARSVYFPNFSRSMAWAESDMRILFEILERLTGALTYFAANQRGSSGTATRDILIDKDKETRFGLWVSRIIDDVTEAIDMWFQLYQDYPPKGLAERIVGEDGKQLFPNLSIDSLRGDNAVQMTPDVVAGSKAYRKQLQLWAFDIGSQSVWLDPRINPRGNWNLHADTFQEILGMTENEVKRYLPEQPKEPYSREMLDDEFRRFRNGEDFDPPEGETQLALQHLEGHMKQKEEKYHELDKEYRPNFDAHLFKTTINVMKLMQGAQRDAMANRLAMNAVMTRESGIMPPEQGAQPQRQIAGEPQPPVKPEVQP